MYDALKVDNKTGMMAKLRRKRLRCRGAHSQPTEADLVRLAGDLGRFFEETGVSSCHSGSCGRWRTRSLASSLGPLKAERAKAGQPGRPTDDTDMWNLVVGRFGAAAAKIKAADEERSIYRSLLTAHEPRSRSRSPPRSSQGGWAGRGRQGNRPPSRYPSTGGWWGSGVGMLPRAACPASLLLLSSSFLRPSFVPTSATSAGVWSPLHPPAPTAHRVSPGSPSRRGGAGASAGRGAAEPSV